MPDIFDALQTIAHERTNDPLSPVTVISPSHAASLQLRRRLATHGPFAAVRFETLPRVAELLGAGRLAASGRSPLARPIGDHASEMVAKESRGVLAGVGELPGYARVLRQIFRRLRRGGIRSSADVRTDRTGHLAEVLRLYDRFREVTKAFYDDEDLLEAAAEAVRVERPGFLPDLGAVYYVPPLPQSAGGAALMEALREVATVVELDDPELRPNETFLIAPDPASEAQEAVRLAIEALEAGVSLHEIAVFHGAGQGYGRLLREAFVTAGVTAVPLPGVPVAETQAGRGVLALARLPELEYSRTGTMDFLSVAPIREWLPAGNSVVHEMTSLWDKLSREALITRGLGRWRGQLESFARERETSAERLDAEEHEQRIAIMKREAEQARRLLSVIEALAARIEPLRQLQPAEDFIAAFKHVVEEYIDPSAPGLEEALEEIDQLGTVGALGGMFSLSSFAESLRANLEARAIRPESIGNGVIIADYRIAPGMRFERVVLCGAFEGALPPGPGTDAILDNRVWQELRRDHPFIEDADLRIVRAAEAVQRAVSSAGEGSLTWSSPAYEAGGSREYFPAPLMARAFSLSTGGDVTASRLRRGDAHDSLRRPSSPLAVALRGPVLSIGELDLRRAVALAKDRRSVTAEHARHRAVESLRARRSDAFSEWEGNLAALDNPAWFELQGAVSPTALEVYATCGYKYFARSLLKLQTVEEPEERQMMASRERGSLIHTILERFFIEQHGRGRPQPYEEWTPDDLARLIAIAEEELATAKAQGLTGLDVFAEHEARTVRADLAQFLEKDTQFRRETGAVPSDFELPIPEQNIAGVRLRGYVDRIDRTPDGRRAWIIDYKTGKNDAKDLDKDPLLGGKKLQLPVYLGAAGDGVEATALYWFISRRADFARVGYEPDDERDQRFGATLEAIVGGIRSGAFPAVPGEEQEYYNSYENCGWCDFERICSRRRDIEYEAKAGDAAMRPWRLVGETASPGEPDV
jgi:RecB family exonuclease